MFVLLHLLLLFVSSMFLQMMSSQCPFSFLLWVLRGGVSRQTRNALQRFLNFLKGTFPSKSPSPYPSPARGEGIFLQLFYLPRLFYSPPLTSSLRYFPSLDGRG